jgi:hypothetical protein
LNGGETLSNFFPRFRVLKSPALDWRKIMSRPENDDKPLRIAHPRVDRANAPVIRCVFVFLVKKWYILRTLGAFVLEEGEAGCKQSFHLLFARSYRAPRAKLASRNFTAEAVSKLPPLP